MIKKTVSFIQFNKISYLKIRLFSFLISLSGLLLTSNIYANQTVLLDANGIPLSDEVLLLLSSGSKQLDQSKKSKTVKEKKSKSKKKAKKKNSSNPLLEEEQCAI